ncbi:MFS transporter [Fontivita pretiosa]|uniref:MFS transporter n=1 Tax=Fontivita pretiosa TaxID=2989684 RepID=UPI003D16961E
MHCRRPAARWTTLHLTWIAFFLTFVVWFNLAPFQSSIGRAMNLTEAQLAVLLICNVALTIPARIAIGAMVDRFGPRRVYTWLLVAAAAPCIAGALASQYWQLVVCRLLVSCIGAGFVVGIRLVGEWFQADEIGLAEGIYGGLGNFGMAAATFGLPLIAGALGSGDGWRWAMIASGVACALYAIIFHRLIRDVPPGEQFRKPGSAGALEVCSRGELLGLLLVQLPLVMSMGVLTWKLVRVGLLPPIASYAIYLMLGVLLVWQGRRIVRANLGMWRRQAQLDPGERYSFWQVVILCLCYAVTFGGELAVESMLPAYLERMFGVSVVVAGMLGAGFALASLIARPLGGLLGDRLGRRPIMIACLGGSTLGFVALAMIDSSWPLWLVMLTVVLAGFFLMAGNGANFCIVPLLRKPLTGQIAGLVGAYGNVGSVGFLLVLSLAGPMAFFATLVAVSAAAFACCLLLREPATASLRASTTLDHTAETQSRTQPEPAPLGGLLPEPA